MEITQKEENGIVSIAIEGRLDADSSPEAEKVVKEALGLLSAAKEMRRREGQIVLCSLNEFVKEIFEVSGFQSLIPIADSIESGIEILS